MAKVNLCNVTVLDNPSKFRNPIQFEITFECIEDLKDDLDWKIIYVGSAESEDYDQILDSVLVGPLVAGKHKFVFQANPPDTNRIPHQDIIGVTVVLLTCSYKTKEFIRVGYYVNNEYVEQELKENPPSQIDFDKLSRNILATCPRVTRFRIEWDDTAEGDTNSENMPPSYNTETESNQMGGDACNTDSIKQKDDSLSDATFNSVSRQSYKEDSQNSNIMGKSSSGDGCNNENHSETNGREELMDM